MIQAMSLLRGRNRMMISSLADAIAHLNKPVMSLLHPIVVAGMLLMGYCMQGEWVIVKMLKEILLILCHCNSDK